MKSLSTRLALSVIASLSISTLGVSAAFAESILTRINETKTLRLGVAPYAPFSYKDTLGSDLGVKQGGDTWRGVAVMMGKEVADSLGAQVEIVELSWTSAIAAIQTGQVDLFFGLEKTPQRATAIEFIETPLYQYSVVFYGKEDFDATSWADLDKSDVTLGIINGTSFDGNLKEHAPNATVQRFPGSSEVLAAFQTGQIDGTIMTPSSADAAKFKLRKGKVTLLKDPEILLPMLGAIPPQNDEEWRDYLNKTFGEMNASGKIRDIYKQEVAVGDMTSDDVSVEFIK